MSKTLNIISANIRFDNKNDGVHIWENRKPILIDSIQSFGAPITWDSGGIQCPSFIH